MTEDPFEPMGRPAPKSLLSRARVGASATIALLAVFVISPFGAGPGALPRENAFWNAVQSSLSQLDQAKLKWANDKQKAEGTVPNMQELAPYMGEWTNTINRLAALGVDYKISPVSEEKPQSDVATLTRALRFERGFCRYYPAGSKISIQGERASPTYDAETSLIAFYQNNRGLLGLVLLLILLVGNVVADVAKKLKGA